MHALMTPVLLRVSGVDSLQLNPEPDPPHAEPRKPRQARRGERRTVIGKDPRGQAVLPESRFHQRPHVRRVAARDPLTTQQIAARRIGNRQRIAAFAVAGFEPTLEIDRPNLVGRLGAGELTGRRGVAPALTGVGESVAFQQRPDSGVRRPIDVRVGALESRFELVFAPSGIARPQGQDLSLDLGGKGALAVWALWIDRPIRRRLVGRSDRAICSRSWKSMTRLGGLVWAAGAGLARA